MSKKRGRPRTRLSYEEIKAKLGKSIAEMPPNPAEIELSLDGRQFTPVQESRVIKPEEMPPCVGNPGDPCKKGIQAVMIAGYDDKLRCNDCNRVHLSLVEKEAGSSNPNAIPQFVSARLDAATEQKRREVAAAALSRLEGDRTNPMTGKVEAGQRRGGTGIPSDVPTMAPLDGEAPDMRAAREGTSLDPNLSDDERRAAVMAKYGRLRGGS